jgi:hypothetical protein
MLCRKTWHTRMPAVLFSAVLCMQCCVSCSQELQCRYAWVFRTAAPVNCATRGVCAAHCFLCDAICQGMHGRAHAHGACPTYLCGGVVFQVGITCQVYRGAGPQCTRVCSMQLPSAHVACIQLDRLQHSLSGWHCTKAGIPRHVARDPWMTHHFGRGVLLWFVSHLSSSRDVVCHNSNMQRLVELYVV